MQRYIARPEVADAPHEEPVGSGDASLGSPEGSTEREAAATEGASALIDLVHREHAVARSALPARAGAALQRNHQKCASTGGSKKPLATGGSDLRQLCAQLQQARAMATDAEDALHQARETAKRNAQEAEELRASVNDLRARETEREQRTSREQSAQALALQQAQEAHANAIKERDRLAREVSRRSAAC